MGNLREIGGNADFFLSQVRSLKNLEIIGADAYLNTPYLTDIGNLRVIKGNASFENASIQSLKNLEIIGGGADFTLHNLQDLGKLRLIGGKADFSIYKPCDLNNLEFIGGEAIFCTPQINNMPPKLKAIGGNLNLSANSGITSLGSVRAIGGDIEANSSNLKDFGALEYLGGKLRIDYNQKYDKTQIQKAQSNSAGAQIIEDYRSSLAELLNQF